MVYNKSIGGKELVKMVKMKEPLTAKNLILKNRLIMPPMASSTADEEGRVSDKLLSYYDEKTAGGHFSLVITEHSYISPEGKAHPKQVSIADDQAIDGLSKIVEIVHKNSSKIAAQISHAGAAAEGNGLPSIGPSVVALPKRKAADHAMSREEIEKTVENFARAAVRAKKAGYDAVELHSAHGYLLDQFYSPLTNHREDEYGGSIENRIRIHLEAIRAVREAVGDGYPILLRLGAMDYQEGGNLLADAIAAAKAFEQAGISILDVSGGMNGYIVRGKGAHEGYYTDVTSALKKEISIPVIMTGGITEIEDGERILENGEADLIGVGRAVFKDSDWVKRAAEKVGI